jgi:hypothetical protein
MWRWEWIGHLAKEHGWKVGAEIGVLEGRTIAYLTTLGIAMIGVDLWKPLHDAEETYEQHDLERYFSELKDALKGRDATLLRMDTVEAADQVRDGALDFVFIDADHSYAGVKRDIEAWTPKVRKGGAVMGHDYDRKDSVAKAVDEAFPEITEGPNKCWLAWK